MFVNNSKKVHLTLVRCDEHLKLLMTFFGENNQQMFR